MPVILIATLALLAYSLWVRRDTWWTRWENAASLTLVLLAAALVLMSPWAAAGISPVLHDGLGVWNLQVLIGHLCLIVAVTANIYHMLLRLADPAHVRVIMRRHLLIPVALGVALMGLTYLRSYQSY